MRFAAIMMGLMFLALGCIRAAGEPRVLTKVNPLPVALDHDFQFRKTKLYLLADPAVHPLGDKANKLSSVAPDSKGATIQDASITFERQYRLYGAVTSLDQRQHYGNYFTFFWRAKRDANITMRLEYRQEKLHAHVQAQEVSFPNARGSHKTDFKVIGDDYYEDGRVIAWRCLLIENGRIVAENRSFIWE
jgi:hypothetical protein